jgi:glyoxylase-like metal-dependent hydrolase (beta-lactamase superfamily II)
MQLAPSLHRIGSSSLVNSYLVAQPDGITVVDTGMAGQWPDLLRELDAMGRSLGDIRAVLLTHGDVDHVGFAERLRRDHGVPVYVGEADAAEARGEVKKPAAERDPMRIWPLLRFLWFGIRKGGLRSTPIREVRIAAPGATLDLPGAPRVIALSGHTPGSLAYHVPALDAVFVGDAMTTRSVLTGVAGPAQAPFTVNRATALASLSALDGIEATWVLPGHGEPWSGGLRQAVALVRDSAATPGVRGS